MFDGLEVNNKSIKSVKSSKRGTGSLKSIQYSYFMSFE